MKAIRKNAHLHILHVGVYPFKIFSMYIEAYIDGHIYTMHTILQHVFFLLNNIHSKHYLTLALINTFL